MDLDSGAFPEKSYNTAVILQTHKKIAYKTVNRIVCKQKLVTRNQKHQGAFFNMKSSVDQTLVDQQVNRLCTSLS